MNADQWRNIGDLWRDRCASSPDHIAVEDGVVRWTYRDLQQRADAWAAALSDASPSSATVAIHLAHDAEIIASLFGILASGRSFIALDPTHPIGQRIAQFKLCDARLIICRSEDEASLGQATPDAMLLTSDDLRPENKAAPASVQPDSIAHFAFTSGSSGKPKAVAMPHRTAIAGASILQLMLNLDAADRHALLSPLAVPATIAQVLGVLSAGAALCLFEARAHSIDDLAAWLTNQHITTIQTIPSLLRRLALHANGKKLWPDLRVVKLGGEPALAADADLFAQCAADNVAVINGLGLTETGFNVCWSTWRRGEQLVGEFLPIGHSAPSVEIEIESNPGRRALDGEIGEIVVRSPLLPYGYRDDPDATASAYRELPDRCGWRELRTGDAGRRRSDGLLEYAGRLDGMVKVRGHRVIPSEVEAAIVTLPGVERAAVLVRKDGDEHPLHAFVQLRGDARRQPGEIRHDLAAKLPTYMLPGKIDLIESVPLLPNGKIDRIKLSKQATELVSPPDIVPLDLLTLQLLNIWKGVFGNDKIGTRDDFFALGGDSLTAATILAAVQKLLGIDLPAAIFLQAPTVEKLAGVIRDSGWRESDVRVVTLRLGGRRPPLYCVPGAGCDAIQFRSLADNLHEDQPVFAFQPRGLDGRSRCQRSIEEMAESYVIGMRIRQPDGPYYLCGSSFGGVVAFEMARRLIADGAEVNFVGLLDSYAGEYPRRRSQLGLRKRVKLALWHLLPLDRKHVFTLPSFGRGFLQWMARRLVDLAFFLGIPAPRRPYNARYFYLEEICLRARPRYEPKPFRGKLYLFRAEIQPPSDLFEPEPLLGWEGKAAGGVKIFDLPGFHRAYLLDPGVADLAEKLTACLAAAGGMNFASDSARTMNKVAQSA